MSKHLSWKAFNAAVLDEEDERVLVRWLKELKQAPNPHLQRMIRVHSRINKLRAARERRELEALVRGKVLEVPSKEASA